MSFAMYTDIQKMERGLDNLSNDELVNLLDRLADTRKKIGRLCKKRGLIDKDGNWLPHIAHGIGPEKANY